MEPEYPELEGTKDEFEEDEHEYDWDQQVDDILSLEGED